MLNQKSTTSSEQPKNVPFKIKRTTTEEFSGDPKTANTDAIIKAAYGAKMPKMQEGGPVPDVGPEGGMATGPSHAQGGQPVVDQSGEQVAEIEGGERVFSQEDTAAMEDAAQQIIQAMEGGDEAGAQDLAMRLGFAVVEMIAAQEQNQGQAEAGAPAPTPPPAGDDAAVAAANSFGQAPEEMETMS